MKRIAFTLFVVLFFTPTLFAQAIDGEEYEELASYWKDALKDVKHRLGLSDNDFNVFTSFYRLKNDSMQYEFHKKIRLGKLTRENILGYEAFVESQELFMYQQFEQVKRNYPSSVTEYALTKQSKPLLTCNPGCTNIDFGNGTLSGWNAYYANNASETSYSITGVVGGPCGAVTGAANDPNTNFSGFGNDYQVEIMSGGTDPLASVIPRVYPGSKFSVRLGDSTNPNSGVAIINQTFVVTAANANLTYEYAIFLENPIGHTIYEQPFFNQVLLNSSGDTISHCLNYNVVSSNAAANGFDSVYYNKNGNNDYVYYKDWIQVFADLQGYIGQCVTLQFECADCSPGGHFGYAYIDASCSGLSVINSSPVICGNGITLTAPPGATGYRWLGPPNGIVGPSNTQSILADSAGTYKVIIQPVTGQACSDTLSITIKKSNSPAIRDSIVSIVDEKCFGDKNGSIIVGAKGGTPPLAYLWNNGDTTLIDTGLAAGTYTLSITDSNGCGAKIIDTVKQPAKLVGSIKAQHMCAGQSATLTASAKGGTKPYSFIWNNTTTGSTYTVSPLVTTTYTMTVTDTNGCTAPPIAVVVAINPLPVVDFTADTLSGCFPACIKFKDESTVAPDSVNKWLWNFGDGDSSIVRNPDYCYNKQGTFSVSLKVTSDSGCSASKIISQMITTFNHPNPAFTATPQTVSILEPNVTFTDKSTDEYGITNWLWMFNDPGHNTSTLQNPPLLTYTDTGTFCANLKVTNMHGCVDSVYGCVDIQPIYAFYIPSAFTPNHDGLNDVFSPKGAGVCGYTMYIFDRWGVPVFHTSDMNEGWNGKSGSSNVIEQEETYIYLINTVDCVHHQAHRYVGNVTLLK
jgi:gliding motility-associated-like protein